LALHRDSNEGKEAPASKTPCTQPVRLSKKAWVPGGGVALIRAQKSLDKLEGANEDRRSAFVSCRAPSRSRCVRIVENAGDDPAVILNRVKEGKGSFGTTRHGRVR